MLWEGRGHETSAGHAGGLAAQQLGSETCCPGRPVEATSPRDRAWNVPWKLDAARQVLPPGETPPPGCRLLTSRRRALLQNRAGPAAWALGCVAHEHSGNLL